MKNMKVVLSVVLTVLQLTLILAAIYVVYTGAVKCHDYGYRIFAEPPMTDGEGRAVQVVVTETMKPKDIGELFAKKGLIRDSKLFILQYYLSEFRKEVKPGQFELSTSMTVEEMMEAMTVVPEASGEEPAAE